MRVELPTKFLQLPEVGDPPDGVDTVENQSAYSAVEVPFIARLARVPSPCDAGWVGVSIWPACHKRGDWSPSSSWWITRWRGCFFGRVPRVELVKSRAVKRCEIRESQFVHKAVQEHLISKISQSREFRRKSFCWRKRWRGRIIDRVSSAGLAWVRVVKSCTVRHG